VNEGYLWDIFDDGRRGLVLKEAAAELMERAEVGRSAAYDALKLVGGRFSNLLTKREGLIWLRATQFDDHEHEILSRLVHPSRCSRGVGRMDGR